MKNKVFGIFWLVFLACQAFGQRGAEPYAIRFKEGQMTPVENGHEGAEASMATMRSGGGSSCWVYLQFYDQPSPDDRRSLAQNGIRLVRYLSSNAWLCQLSINVQFRSGDIPNVRASFEMPAAFKLDPALRGKGPRDKTINVRVYFQTDHENDPFSKWLAESGCIVLDGRLKEKGWIDLAAVPALLEKIASIPNVLGIGRVPVDEEIRYEAETLERANALTNSLVRDLHGVGIVVGIGDGGKIGEHADLGGRVTGFASFGISGHATHVAGIIGGYPNLNPRQGSGIADEVEMITNNFSDIIVHSPVYMADYGMVITNNSYGSNLGNCTLMGDYTSTSALIDQQMTDHPELLHVFSAGNNGSTTCNPYPQGYATVLGSYQASKNALIVGSCSPTDALSGFSARGPVDDGRIKPEIVAQGSAVSSTRPGNLFGSGSGTSYSGPAVAGISALLYERYKQLHAGQNPRGDLVKALLCNTADDLGNTGPDYRWGFGRVNAKRAVEAMENGQYLIDEISHAQQNIHQLAVPPGVAELKVMLLWNDPPAVPYIHNALINDLDLEVTTSGGDAFLPWVLNPAADHVADPAFRGVDHMNNYEQVTIENPAPGNYSISISGHDIPTGAQSCVLAWDFIMEGVELTYPAGGEKWVSGENELIRWDAPATANAFSFSYSPDLGGTWTVIDDAIPSDRRYYNWTPPVMANDSVLIRISENNTSHAAEQTLPLSVMPLPGSFSAANLCAGTVSLEWAPVDGAMDYSVYTIVAGQMQEVATVTTTADTIFGVDESKTHWWAVSANHPSGTRGRRTNAVSTPPASGVCAFDQDIRVLLLSNPGDGRKSTSLELSAAEPVGISIVNNGTVDVSNIPVAFTLNGGAAVLDTVPLIPVGDTTQFQFEQTIDLSIAGEYQLVCWSALAGDPVGINDTVHVQIRHLANDPLILPHTVGYESTPELTTDVSAFGLPGAEFLDFQTAGGRLRTFAGSSFTRSGNRALTLDAGDYGNEGENLAILTFNLSGYGAGTDDIRLNFSFMHHEIVPDDDSLDLIWIRGSDADPWIEAYDLYDHFQDAGSWSDQVLGIEVSRLLLENNQDFSSSFQLRFGQQGSARADEPGMEDGLTVDDIKLYTVTGDLQLVSILSPGNIACGLGNEQITIRVRNASADPVVKANAAYVLDGGTVVSEEIASEIPAGAMADFTFTTLADLSATGLHTLDAWVYHESDSYRANDSLLNHAILHFPEVDSFPYLETFESGPGGWMPDGKNNSWAWGEPANTIIDRAAKGEKAWVTNLEGNHNAYEQSYVYSPCFNTSMLAQPALSFAHQFILEDNYDYVWVEYSLDSGLTWDTLGSVGSGVNWYNDDTANAWDGSQAKWRNATQDILAAANIQFRFALYSDVGLQNEGFAFDNVYVYDRAVIYTGPDTSAMLSLAGDSWVDIEVSGQKVASVQPDGQDLGMLSVHVYNHAGSVRNTGTAYLLDRNWVIATSQPPVQPVSVRIYFTDGEAEALLSANDCPDCREPEDIFLCTVMQYSGPDEDGDWANNAGPAMVHAPDSIRLVPYDEGYYAEVRVDGFSEFWIASVPVPRQDSICLQVSAPNDDAEERVWTGAVDPYSEVLEISETDTSQVIGLRFPGASIPKGSYITSAHLQFTSSAPSSGAANALITGLSQGASVASFNTANYNITGRTTKTGNHVNWNIPAWPAPGESGPAHQSPDLSLLVQEAVSGNSWQPGNALGFILRGTGVREAWSFEGDHAGAPKLMITYDSICNRSGRLYVMGGGAGLMDGTSWANALPRLQEALTIAAACPEIQEIWVKEGTYRTSLVDDRAQSFTIQQGIRIFGGFDGTEATPDDRDLQAHPSYLDGDIGVPGDSLDNAFHLLVTSAAEDTIFIDGFRCRNALANGPGFFENLGGGVYNTGKLHLRNILFENIQGTFDGYIMFSFLAGADMIMEECSLMVDDSVPFAPVYNISEAQMRILGNVWMVK